MSQHNRQLALIDWLSKATNTENISLESMTGDAGFRQYFRFVDASGQSLIAVDSPSEKCNNNAFIQVQKCFQTQGVKVPQIIAVDEKDGFFCLSDLGTTMLADRLSADTMNEYYAKAMAIIPQIAHVNSGVDYRFPVFDRVFIQQELTIFTEWLVSHYLDISTTDMNKLQACFDVLIESALVQPQVTMHRDYHSRNLMLDENEQLAVIDFQDAVQGPITYDVVSLLRDCYVRWPDDQVYTLLERFIKQSCTEHPEYKHYSRQTWRQWFDLMGLQRHIKAAGIFARLHLRDGKPGYLKDIPLTLTYIKDVSAQYPELAYLHQFVRDIVIPTWELKS